MKRYNFRKLDEVDGKEEYYVKVSKRFVALETLNDNVDINTTWESIRKNI
jgi:hypothetical protein